MATRVVTNDMVLIRTYCFCNIAQQLSINDWWYVCGGHTGVGTFDSVIVTNVGSSFSNALAACMSSSAEYRGATINVYKPGFRAAITEFSTTGAQVGLRGATLIPLQVSGIVTKRGNAAGRGSFGRCYIGFPASDCTTTGVFPNAAYLTALTGVASVYDAVVTEGTVPDTSTIAPALVTRLPGNQATNPRIVFTTVASNKFATQRKRGGYGRTNTPPF